MNQNIKQKRMMKEIQHINENPSEEYKAGPLNNDLYTWHFTIRGPPDTEFEDGIYHGQIIFPFNYPHEPPDIYFLNKSGRFEVNKKICLTITGFHADQWNSSWTMRLMLEALISMFPEKELTMSVGSLNQSPEERKRLAKDSWNFECEKCGPINKFLKQREKKSTQTTNNNSSLGPQIHQLSQRKFSEQKKVVEPQIDEKQIKEDLQKQQHELKMIEQKLKKLNENKLKNAPTIQEMTQNQHQTFNYQYQPQVNTNREYSFNMVLNNLEETMNVINSIRLLDNNAQSQQPTSQQSDKKTNGEKTDMNKSQKKDDDNDTKNTVLGSDQKKKEENTGAQSNLDDKQEDRQEINIDEASNKQAEGNKETTEDQKEERKVEEEKNDDQESGPELDDHADEQEATKEEARAKVKKIESLIYVTLITFIIYITILLQMKI